MFRAYVYIYLPMSQLSRQELGFFGRSTRQNRRPDKKLCPTDLGPSIPSRFCELPCSSMATTYTDDQKTHAVDLYTEHGASEAGRRLGIPSRTITRWAGQAGAVSQASREKTATARASAAEDVAKEWRDFRSAEARGSGAAALAIRRQVLNAAEGTPVRHSSGEIIMRTIVNKETGEKREVPYIQVDGKNLQALATSYGIMIDKAELLSGNATERVETWARGELDHNLKTLVEEFEEVARNNSH